MKPLQVTATANASLQNRINISIVFHHIRASGPVYRAKIARDLKLSAPAVSRAVEALKAEGYVIETEKVRTGSGKRAAHVMVNSTYGWVIGVDLLKAPTKIAVANLQCDIVEEYNGFVLDDTVDVETELCREIGEVIRQHGRPDELKAIAVGVPAVVDESGKVASAFLYASLEGRRIKGFIEERFGVPTFVDNGVNLSALAESKHGEGKHSRSFVFVEIGNGIGAGIVVERNVIRGGHGSAGEIGFSLVNGVVGRSRGMRYLEEVASVDSIRRSAVESLKNGAEAPQLLELAGGRIESLTSAAVCSAALAGEPLAAGILAKTTDSLALGIINLALILDPERIILGGDICHLPGVETLFVEPIRRRIAEALPFAAPDIILSSLHDDAGVIGGAQLAVDSLLTGMYPYRMDEQAEKT